MQGFPKKTCPSKKPALYACRHCSRTFAVRTDLGGHVRKMHAGSEKYAAKRAKRDSREIERAVHDFSKAINIAMNEKRLDDITLNYFKWKNGRMVASEREVKDGVRTQEMATDPKIVKRDKTAQKGRVRRIKVKTMRLLDRPRTDWDRLVGSDWMD